MAERGDVRVADTWNVAVGDSTVSNFYCGPHDQCVLVTDRHIVSINGKKVVKVFDVCVVASVFACEENALFAVLKEERLWSCISWTTSRRRLRRCRLSRCTCSR